MRLNNSLNLIHTLVMGTTLLALTGCGGGSASSDQDDTNDTLTGFNLVWSDEFEGNSLDASKWNVETGYGPNNAGWGNDESQLYMNSSDNLKVENDNLVITARCDSGVCGKRDGSITSAKINTKDKLELKYGKVEARIKLPDGRSTWPAFWMLGANFPDVPWPRTGEIDILEMHQANSNTNTTHTTIHWFDESRPTGQEWRFDSQRKQFASTLTADYHTFTMEWGNEYIVGKIDGETYFVRNIESVEMSEFHEPFYLIINVAIDGTLGAEPDQIKTTPQDMLVDWVRVYENVDEGSISPIVEPVDAFEGGLLQNGGFENGIDNWTGIAANVTSELLGFGGTRANFANVETAGNPWDVNLSQVVEIIQGKAYQLSFKAKSNGNRSLVAGIGLNQEPFTNSSETINLTSEWQTFDLTLSSSAFGNVNSRVLFDMGADIGQVIIDEVSLIESVE